MSAHVLVKFEQLATSTLVIGDLVFVPHHMGRQFMHGKRGNVARIVALPGGSRDRWLDHVLKVEDGRPGNTPFFEQLYHYVDARPRVQERRAA